MYIEKRKIKLFNMNCEHGYKGMCCCNCSKQIPLNKHPMNKGEGKGSISELMGYACTAFYGMEGEESMIFFDHKHGMCEMHNRKPATIFTGANPDIKEI